MNMQHLVYAVEVDKMKSISKAAENLYMGQPNLSRAIKELEESIDMTIFKRTPRGITTTPEGEEFLRYARSIVGQVAEMESVFSEKNREKIGFNICVPRASYITQAFADFVKNVDLSKAIEFNYKETNSMRTIKSVDDGSYTLGIIRFQDGFSTYFDTMLRDKSLAKKDLGTFRYLALMSEKHPLAQKRNITYADLKQYIELTHGDPYVPYLPVADVKKAEIGDYIDKRIYVYERGSQFDLLSEVASTFMWVSPIPRSMLKRHGLVQRRCEEASRVYRDVLIYKEKHRFTELEKNFIQEIENHRQEIFETAFN